MKVSVETSIQRAPQAVWETITDIEHCDSVISAIEKIEIIDKPAAGVVGLKWKETRMMFGKSAEETMWITEAKAPEYYATRAESHGAVYLTTLLLTKQNDGTLLTMSFVGLPQTLLAKIMSFMMWPLIKSSMVKALNSDLSDIKMHLESLATS